MLLGEVCGDCFYWKMDVIMRGTGYSITVVFDCADH